MGTAIIRIIFFPGLPVLVAGIFLLNAQVNAQDDGDDQNAPTAQSDAIETTPAEASDAVISTNETPADQPIDETIVSSSETNAPAAQPQIEENVEELSEETSVESGESTESGNGEDVSSDEVQESFEIDRSKSSETAETAPMEKEQPVEEKPAAQPQDDAETQVDPDELRDQDKSEKAAAQKPKQKSRGFFGRLFGSGKDEKQKGAGSAKGDLGEENTSVARRSGDRQLTPEELLAAQEEVRRQTTEVEGLKMLDQAYQEMSRKEFEKALVHFSEGLSIMPLRPHTVETRQKAMMSEGECEFRLALDNYQAGKINDAKDHISRAFEYYPGHRGAARLSGRIKQDQETREQVEVKPVPLRKEPSYLEKQATINAEIKRGREYMGIKDYSSAEKEFRNVLVDDKYNSAASANLKKIAEIRYNLESDEFQRMKAEMLAQIRDAWTPPVKRVTTGPKSMAKETMIASQAKRQLEQKLKNIMIQKIEFIDAKIQDVVTYLHQQSLIGDRDSPPGSKGVNILLRLTLPGQLGTTAAPQAEVTDIFAADEITPVGATTGTTGITMTMRDISLMDAIKYITDIAGLKYRIEERVVIIHRPDIALGELETRTYKVLPSTIDTMTGGGAGFITTGETAADKLELGIGGGEVSSDRPDIKRFLIDSGIPFPQNTSIVYIPAPPLLIVKNTAENLGNFENLLTKLNVPTVQVQIEARFVEIGQTDLKELGLEWLLTDNWEIASKPSGERIQMNKNNITKGLRELNVSGGQIMPAVSGTMGSIAAISSILTNPELMVVLHALERSDGVNLLSAPKVTTKSGSNARIKVVEELIYPTEYRQNVQRSGSSTSGYSQQVITTPAAFETRDLGVILDVTPTVGPDNETIELQMLPQVVELVRWIDYGSDIPSPTPGAPVQHITLLQPVFHSRDIQTQLSIWDGQTVVMGGLISEGQRNTEDKIPFLGDLPLIGFLFRSKTTRSVKKNLLIFVTANLVDPAGNKIKKETATSFAGETTTSVSP